MKGVRKTLLTGSDCPNCGGPLKWQETKGRKWLSCDSCFACFLPKKGRLKQVISGLQWKAKVAKGHRKGENHPKAKLSEKDVLTIRRRFDNGEWAADITADYPVSKSAILKIGNGRTWKHLWDREGLIKIRPKPQRGENHPQVKLKEKDVRAIRERIKNGERQADLAREFGVKFSTVSAIRFERTWKGIGPDTASYPLQNKGERHPVAKLTKKDVRAIRERLRRNGKNSKALQKEFGVSKTTIADIKAGRRWKGVGEGE